MMNKLILVVALFFAFYVKAQTYTINQGGSISTCSGTIYDSGGSGGNYSANENYTMTFCSNSSNCLRITLSRDFSGDVGDKIILYDGPTTAYAVIDNIDGAQSFTNGTQYTSTSGCITIKFKSDADVTVGSGFSAVISCVACAATPSYNNPSGFIYTCSANFYDWKGPSTNYTNNLNKTTKFCSSNGTCIKATFSSFSTESGLDVLSIYDGNSTSASLIGTYSGTSSPGIVTSTTGCLTFNFVSDASIVSTGWEAAISCVNCGTPPPAEVENCVGATTVCSDQAFSGNSGGSGSVVDLNSSNYGCLFGENQSSWYYFSPTASGVVELNITPANGTDDYDFAIWGPMSTITCPPSGNPIRCSWAAGGGTTGLKLLSGDASEGAGGDRFVNQLNVTAGEKYILIVDNYLESSQPFTLDWTLSGGATLGCTPLPIELLSFTAKNEGKHNLLKWTTATEINNNYFNVERSVDAKIFESFATVNGAGNSNTAMNYSINDTQPYNGLTYYRLKQTDYNGDYSYSNIISIENNLQGFELSNIHPNPTTDAINFDFYSPVSGELKVQIHDYTGRVVLENNFLITKGKTSLNAPMAELAKGIYSLKATFEQAGFSIVETISKQ
jgi:hypothetical protein